MNPNQNTDSSKRIRTISRLLKALVYAAAICAILFLVAIIAWLLINGLPEIRWSLFSWNYSSENVSLLPAAINTLWMIVLSLLFACPVGIGASLYLCEYLKARGKISQIILVGAQTLGAVPSIVYGLFGSIFFVRFLHLGLCLLSGALTMAIMLLPLIIQTSREALMEVDQDLRMASYAMGAGKARTIFQIVLPKAMPGIVNGIILATGRVLGESAALIFTAGTAMQVADSFFSPARTLAVHLYTLSSEGLHMPEAYATGVVLLVVVLLLNACSSWVGKKLEKRIA